MARKLNAELASHSVTYFCKENFDKFQLLKTLSELLVDANEFARKLETFGARRVFEALNRFAWFMCSRQLLRGSSAEIQVIQTERLGIRR